MEGRSPHGERGLKSQLTEEEIRTRLSRSPHGERGLKYGCALIHAAIDRSLPSRGAWIEIGGLPNENT